jgi:fatty-acyl-CoA synthase
MSSDLAKGFVGIGLKRGDRLGIVCRNHRGFVEASIAAAKAGLCVVYLNTSFAAPQMAEVVQRERVAALLIDHSLLRLIDPDSCPVPVIVATQVDGDAHGDLPAGTRSLDDVRSTRGPRLPLRASMPVAPILLTSGTTGTPKGAERSNRADPSGAASFIERIPYRHDDVVAITSPLFHAWGLAQLFLASALGATAALIFQLKYLIVVQKRLISILMKLKNLKNSIYRSRICVVGPSGWGKTSLVKSLISGVPEQVTEDIRTIGIDQ